MKKAEQGSEPSPDLSLGERKPRFQYADSRIDAFELATRAVELRANQSPPEGILWSYLRARRTANLKFRRQYPIGPYTLDFYCHEARLCIEVDGRTHNDRVEHDERRTQWLRTQGIEVIRFSASEVTTHPAAVAKQIGEIATSRIK